jgi:Hpt domain
VSEQKTGPLFPPLRQKVGFGRLGAIDPGAIAKAEAALKSLSGNFAQWLNDEITKLEAAHQTVRDQGATDENMESLYLRAHDLKGLGATYGFPLITRIAGLLCRLIDEKPKRPGASMALVAAHIDAIRNAARDDIRTEDHPVGSALVQDLESRVREFGA